MRCLLTALAISLMLVNQGFAQCATGGAVWLNGLNNGQFRDTGLLGGYVFAEAVTSGTMVSGRPLYTEGSSVWKGLNYASLQVWRAYSSPGSNSTYFKLSQALDSSIFHVRVDNIRGDVFNWESQNVRGYFNGVEVPADFKDPVNGATVSGNTIAGASSTTSATQSAMRVFFHAPVDSIVVRQVSWGDWIIAELQVQCNILLPVTLAHWSATLQNDHISLQWSVLTETDIRNYTLQYSTDGRNFSDLALISKNNSGNYHYHFGQAHTGNHYFRIRINQYGGSTTFSSIKRVRWGVTSYVRIFPNPAHQHLNIELPSADTEISIWNAQGIQMLRARAKKWVSLDVSYWSRGIYFVRVNSASGAIVERVILQ